MARKLVSSTRFKITSSAVGSHNFLCCKYFFCYYSVLLLRITTPYYFSVLLLCITTPYYYSVLLLRITTLYFLFFSLQKAVDYIVREFTDSGLTMSEFSRDNVKLHITLINTLFRREKTATSSSDKSRRTGPKRDVFNARPILKVSL